MLSRSSLSEKERYARSRLTKLVHEQPFIRGCLVLLRRRCGKPNCQCNGKTKHLCYCLGVRHQGKRQMIYVPLKWEERIRQWIQTHKEIGDLMEVVSESCIEELVRFKKGNKYR